MKSNTTTYIVPSITRESYCSARPLKSMYDSNSNSTDLTGYR